MAIFHIRALAGSRTSIDSSPILLFWWEALVWANLDLRPPVQRNSGAQWPLGSWSHLLQRAFSLQVPQFGQTGRPSHNPSLCFFPPMCVMSHETQRRQACCLANHYGRETSQRWWRPKGRSTELQFKCHRGGSSNSCHMSNIRLLRHQYLATHSSRHHPKYSQVCLTLLHKVTQDK